MMGLRLNSIFLLYICWTGLNANSLQKGLTNPSEEKIRNVLSVSRHLGKPTIWGQNWNVLGEAKQLNELSPEYIVPPCAHSLYSLCLIITFV